MLLNTMSVYFKLHESFYDFQGKLKKIDRKTLNNAKFSRMSLLGYMYLSEPSSPNPGISKALPTKMGWGRGKEKKKSRLFGYLSLLVRQQGKFFLWILLPSVTYVCFQVISHYSLWIDLFSVGLARLVDYSFLEPKITMNIAQMDGISEFTLSKNIDDAWRYTIDFNEAPSL